MEETSMEGSGNFTIKSPLSRTLTSKGKLRHGPPDRKIAILPSLYEAEMNLFFSSNQQ